MRERSGLTDKPKVRADVAWAIARELQRLLIPACEAIAVAGSLRRRKEFVGDVELLAIPKFNGPVDLLDVKVQRLISEGILEHRRNKVGSIVYGPKNKLLRHGSGVAVDIFSTTPDCWAVALVVRTGGATTNKEIATRALERGLRFHAYGRGFTRDDGTEIVCRSEEEVFEAVGLPYKQPWERA